MTNLEILDKILLSDNVVDNFYKHYSNKGFNTWLNSILPEIERCHNQKQDNPWHIYNCLDHILHSVEEINKLTKSLSYNTRKMLAYTMFYHDIGKPASYIRRFSKLYGKEVDSFFNHNVASREIAKRTLSNFGFDEKTSSIIEQLVYKHDTFMFITLVDDGNRFHKVLSQKVLEDEIEDFNQYENKYILMKYLIMVGRADNLAQNPKMTENSLLLLDKMDEMLKNYNFHL